MGLLISMKEGAVTALHMDTEEGPVTAYVQLVKCGSRQVKVRFTCPPEVTIVRLNEVLTEKFKSEYATR